MFLSKWIFHPKLMRKCGGNVISARRKADGRRVDGSLF
jgi:hypothetical protein